MREGEIGLVALVKGQERYVFTFTQDTAEDLYKTFGRFASNDELSFSWHDSGVLCNRVRRLLKDKDA